MIFQNDSLSIVYYDVDKDEWSEESCDATKAFSCFSTVKCLNTETC